MLNIERLYFIKKRTVVKTFLYGGMALAYLGSLNPWFLWPLGPLYIILACFLMLPAFLVSNSMEEPVFCRWDFLPAIFTYIIILCYMPIVNGSSILGLVLQLFNIGIFFALFRLDPKELSPLTTFLAKVMAILLAFSIVFFFLHLLGFPLPSRNAIFGDDAKYTYTNYYFFMIDDRALWSTIIPRFHAVFLEPSHLGVACIFLLLTQCGKWQKWYNIILFVAVFMTFSLEAYVLLTFLFFFNLWIHRKKIIKKLVALVFTIAVIVIGAFHYNSGDNLIHDLILLRLEVEDGEMAGNNRTTSDFDDEFSNFLSSSDILFGREYKEYNNSGYKVFIYENGVVGLIFLVVFYSVALSRPLDRRAFVAAAALALLDFIVRAFPLWYSNFIPVYCMVSAFQLPQLNKKTS